MAERRAPDGSTSRWDPASYAVRPDDAGVAASMAVLDRRVGSAAEARSWLGEFLSRSAVAVKVCEDAVLVISELVTNALLHGQGRPVVRAGLAPGWLELSVTDSGPELPELLARDPERVGGIGLVIVDQLSQAWGVASFPGGKTVWATLVLNA